MRNFALHTSKCPVDSKILYIAYWILLLYSPWEPLPWRVTQQLPTLGNSLFLNSRDFPTSSTIFPYPGLMWVSTHSNCVFLWLTPQKIYSWKMRYTLLHWCFWAPEQSNALAQSLCNLWLNITLLPTTATE